MLHDFMYENMRQFSLSTNYMYKFLYKRIGENNDCHIKTFRDNLTLKTQYKCITSHKSKWHMFFPKLKSYKLGCYTWRR